VRGLLAMWLLGLTACLPVAVVAADKPAFELQWLGASESDPPASALTSGSLDSQFVPFDPHALRPGAGTLWLKVRPAADFMPVGLAVLTVRRLMDQHVEMFANRAGQSFPLTRVSDLPGFAGVREDVFILPEGLKAGEALYARVDTLGQTVKELHFALSALDQILARGAEHARMIALAFGALMAMALSTLLVWFVLSDNLFVLYGTQFSLTALYLAFVSGQGFDWPILAYARPLNAYAWNVPIALAGAAACLFVREIADLRHFSPRICTIFGWIAVAFVAVAFANLADFIGLGQLVVAIGNLVFIGSAVFTLVVVFLAWRRGNRAAGWFLIAWGMLESFAIAVPLRLLFSKTDDADGLLYYGFPLSMVAGAVLIALGVAERMQAQRLALTEAERRAQTDPLTGVLNRRSLVERLDAACLRARARSLPIALLFIDLDHFKEINDSFGHAAGDACLSAIIAPIQAELRQSDVIGRYGGEEFVVILSSADISAAHPIAERIRKRVADVRIDGFGKPIRLTCSIGVATSDTLGVWGEHLIAQADAAVYAAKRAGRNRVQVAAPLAA
jgi:diguanylate cyclase (GGDEF)-like protein